MFSAVPQPIKVFLCYGAGDKRAVRELYQRLTADGFKAWLDEEDLIPGQKWQTEIYKAVRESNVVLVCLSQRSASKEGFVQKEIRFALDTADEKPEGAVYLIPARLEECNIPERLSQFQWVDLYKDTGYPNLLRALQTIREGGIPGGVHAQTGLASQLTLLEAQVQRSARLTRSV